MIGFTLLRHFVRSPMHKSCEIGWALNNRFWGQGYAAEAVKATLQIAFEELDLWRVEAPISKKNTKSIKLAKKLDFDRIGVSKSHFIIDSEAKDLVLFSITK